MKFLDPLAVFTKGCAAQHWCATRTVKVCHTIYFLFFHCTTNLHYFKFLGNVSKMYQAIRNKAVNILMLLLTMYIRSMNQIFCIPAFLYKLIIINYLHNVLFELFIDINTQIQPDYSVSKVKSLCSNGLDPPPSHGGCFIPPPPRIPQSNFKTMTMLQE
jgi:hypothetical protein